MLYSPLVSTTSPTIAKSKIEIIRLRKEGEYFDVQVAIDGVLSPSMEIHASSREQYREEKDFLDYIARSAQTMIDLYGDARHPLPAMTPEEMATAGFM